MAKGRLKSKVVMVPQLSGYFQGQRWIRRATDKILGEKILKEVVMVTFLNIRLFPKDNDG